MALPNSGQISASDINTEASRTGSTTGPLAGTVGTTPTAISFVGLYANSTPVFPPMNVTPSYKYSDFYGRTFVVAPSPWWIINTTYSAGLNGKNYTSSGGNIIPNNSDPLSTAVKLGPTFDAASAGILTINDNQDMIIVAGAYSTSTSRYYPVWQRYLRSFYTSSITNSFRGMSDKGIFIDYPGSINHVAADAIYLQDDNTKVFWLDQEFATDNDGAVDIRRYGVFSVNTSTYAGFSYPELWQYTGWTRQIDDSTQQQGYFYSQPRATSLSNIYLNTFRPSNDQLDEDIINIYVVNQIKNENLANDREYNGGITKIEYDKTTATGTSVALDSPTFKVWQINKGVGTGTTMPNSNHTTFNDICSSTSYNPR